ncbi:hypothetical protein JCM9533A_32650 [Catenuloplanes niger JCM 9533]
MLCAAVALAVPAGAVFAAPAHAGPYPGRTVLADGHVDVFDARFDDGLRLVVHDGTGAGAAVDRSPADVVLHVRDAGRTTAPDGLEAALPGFATAGQDVWVMPQTQISGQLFAGWATERIARDVLGPGSRVRFEVSRVDGPGRFALWQNGLTGPAVKVNSGDGLPDAFDTAATYTHDHANWGFSAPGEYTLTVGATATLADGSTVTAPPATYTFFVGETLPDEPGAGEVTIGGWRDTFTEDGTYPLTAHHTPDPRVVTYRWSYYIQAVDLDGVLKWMWLDWGGDHPVPTYDFAAWDMWDGGQLRVSLLDADGRVLAQSEPREIRVTPALPEQEGLHVLGVAGHYHTGGTAQLTAAAVPAAELTGVQWLIRDSADADWTAVAGATTAHYAFVVGPNHDGMQVTVRSATPALESAPVTIHVDDHGQGPAGTKSITTTLGEDAGGLFLSVAPEDRDVVLSDLTLDETATGLVAAGELGAVSVTDTRTGGAGWNVSARASDFVAPDGTRFDSAGLGWTPRVVEQGDGMTVSPGAAVTGLNGPRVLGSADTAGRGRAVLDAGLTLRAPVELPPGTYTSLLTLSVI